MKLAISNATGVPIYEQLKRQIKAAILAGELRGGEVLPSLRTVARDLRISVLTATRAYTELEQEGFVANVQGKGCYVREQDSDLLREQFLRRAEEGLGEAITAAGQAGLSAQELHGMLDILLNEKHQGE
jgi:GntR family transcriptional regulator